MSSRCADTLLSTVQLLERQVPMQVGLLIQVFSLHQRNIFIVWEEQPEA